MSEQDPGGSHYFGRRLPEAMLADRPHGPVEPRKEPVSRAPWPALLVAASILLVFLGQSATGDIDGWNMRYGLHPGALFAGRGVETLVTALWSHASWGHALSNAVFALAFGAPVARLFGLTARGVLAFFAFYLLGGAVASLVFAAIHRLDDAVIVGASGAVSALTGGAARLLYKVVPGERATPAPLSSTPVVVMSIVFIVGNLVLGLTGLDMGQGAFPPAWEAHIAGYVFGLLMIQPFAQAARLSPPPVRSPG